MYPSNGAFDLVLSPPFRCLGGYGMIPVLFFNSSFGALVPQAIANIIVKHHTSNKRNGEEKRERNRSGNGTLPIMHSLFVNVPLNSMTVIYD